MAYACYTCHPFTSSLLVANSSIQVSYFNWLLISFQHEHGINFFKGEDAIMRNTCKRLSCTSKIEMLEYSRVIYAWLTEFLLQLDHNSDSLTMQHSVRSGQDQLVWTLDMGSKLKGKQCTTKPCTLTPATTCGSPLLHHTHQGLFQTTTLKKDSLFLCGKGTHTSTPTTPSKHSQP